MGVIESKTFKSGNSVAVRLPRELGFAPDVPVTIEQTGTTLTIKPAFDPVEEKRKVIDLVARLEKIWEGVPRELRRSDPAEERIEFPDRPGLY